MKHRMTFSRQLIAPLCVLLAALWCLSATPAVAQSERILDFHSDIQVHEDGSMQVTETIRVRSAGRQIRHGIYRDFPTRYTDQFGYGFVVGFRVLAATRDGLPETFRVEDRDNGQRIYLGRSDALLSVGDHTYTITYATNREIGFFPDHDELYWNVTGNGWIFYMDHASATVRLPDGTPAERVQKAGYTGRQGSRDQNLTFEKQDDGSFTFTASGPFQANEGLTILLTWPKGYVTPPTQAQKLQYFVDDNRDTIIGLLGLALLLLYYTIVWLMVGRDPAPGAIVTLYEPPPGFSPAGMRYLVRMSFDNKAFASAILDMAVKGYLKIEEQAGEYTLNRASGSRQALSPEEQAAADQLFEGAPSVRLRNDNHTRISEAIRTLTAWLKNAEFRVYFVTNARYIAPAVVFSLLVLVGIVLSQSPQRVVIAAFLTVWVSLWTLGVYTMVSLAVHLWQSVLASGTPNQGVTLIQAIAISAFSVPFLGFEIFGLVFLGKIASPTLVIAVVGFGALHGLFHHLLKRPTRAGRAVLDKIEGFKRFLTAVDADRMNRAAPAQNTPEVFEKFLPYALALDVENAWAAKFSSVLNGASSNAQGSAAYSPAWYSGTAWNGLGAGAFVSSLSGSLAGAISSSASAPGSTGGGGSGGGSGGGGGGGGGGGW